MSSTNKTTNYELTQFLATDVPSWLVDYNGDMSKIDTQMKANATAAATAQSKADGADEKADTNAADIDSLEAALDTPSTGILARLSDVEGDVDTLQELMGNGTPTTTDHTVIGAINELNSDLNGVGGLGEDVSVIEALLGNATLETEAQTVTAAINELNSAMNTTEYAIFIGDSYTGATSLGDDIEHRYSTQLAKKLKVTEKNYAVGGSGFTTGTKTYAEQTDDAIADFTASELDKNKVKYFIIGGTRNDKASNLTYSTYNQAVRSVLTKVLNNFPNAKIVVLSLIYDANYMPQYYLKFRGWLSSIIAQFRDTQVGALFIDCFTWLSGSYNDILYQDGANVHPSITGHSVIAQHAYSAIMGNNYTPSATGEYDSTAFVSGVNTTNSFFRIAKMNGDIKIDLSVQVDDYTLLPINTTIYSKTYNLSQFDVYCFGNQKFQVALNNGVILEIEATISKTGDTAGTATVTIKNLAAFSANGTFIATAHLMEGILADPTDE